MFYDRNAVICDVTCYFDPVTADFKRSVACIDLGCVVPHFFFYLVF